MTQKIHAPLPAWLQNTSSQAQNAQSTGGQNAPKGGAAAQNSTQRPNPFSRPAAAGTAGTSSAQSPFSRPQGQPQQPQQPPAGQRPNPPGGLLNRFGSRQLNWDIVPTTTMLVRFDLTGLGDPFHRLLGLPLNLAFGDLSAVIRAFEQRVEGVEQVEQLLDAAWASYAMCGAMLVYPWSAALKKAVLARPLLDRPQKPQSDDGEEDTSEPPPPPGAAVGLYRAVDLLLVLNVLARARSQLLITRAPLALDGRYLNRSIVTDDPRLVALAMATGCIEEHLGT